MKFLLMGCSWGVPNYQGPPGPPKEAHIEYILESHGHSVVNCSWCAGSNLQTLARAKKFLAGEPIIHPGFQYTMLPKSDEAETIDWVVWFQTDFLRDFDKVSRSGMNQIATVAHYTYQEYKNFFDTLNIKLALIGGNMDLFPGWEKYFNPDFVIPSWSSEIFNVTPRTFDQDDPELEIRFMSQNIFLQRLKKTSEDFPDDSHPGARPYAELTKALLSCATNYC